ncbi:hypothetical protein [Paenibacillus aestuarii]|uniref:Bacterial Ig-like domain-containing protein n=1 Tax=Paenibacillus aestuarii TaxID=516965 RepID=A0ABW0KG26_9BACL|nr:hypothetical protein [Paenibacillus aestuarii]
MKKKLRKLGTAAIASLLVLSAVPSVSAATTTTSTVATGRTQQDVATGVIKVDSMQINKKSLTGTVLIDGPELVMSVKDSNGVIVRSAVIRTFPISDKLFGFSIDVPEDGNYVLDAWTVYKNGKTAGQTHTQAKSITVTVDTTPPVITFNPYNTNPTNQSITVQAITNEGSLNETSHTFEANGSFTFVAIDAAGNKTSKTVTISNIDKTAPTATVGYSTTSLVNTDVTATAIPSEKVNFTNEGGSSHVFTENGSFEFTFTDEAGNTGSATAVVNNIDKAAPVGSISYSTIEPTNQNVRRSALARRLSSRIRPVWI